MPNAIGCKRSLKTLGSATSYGIFAQMDRQESDKEVKLTCYGIDPEPYRVQGQASRSARRVLLPAAGLAHYQRRPSAARAAGAARHRSRRHVRDGRHRLHGDRRERSAAASFACPGGPYQMEDGREAIHALSWEQVKEIVALFDRLNPYDRAASTDTILKIEPDNYDPEDQEAAAALVPGDFRQTVRALPARSQRRAGAAAPGINNAEDSDVGWSEHGLGHLLNPSDPTSEDRSWIAQAWLGIVRRSLGLATEPLPFADRVAVGQITVSSPEVLRPLAKLNAGKPYAQQIKPFNFILSCHVAPFGHPIGADPERFHLIAPYETRPAQMARAAVDRSVFAASSTGSARRSPRSTRSDRARQELRRRARRVRVPRRSQVRRCQRRAVRQANRGAAAAAPRHDRVAAALHRQGVE